MGLCQRLPGKPTVHYARAPAIALQRESGNYRLQTRLGRFGHTCCGKRSYGCFILYLYPFLPYGIRWTVLDVRTGVPSADGACVITMAARIAASDVKIEVNVRNEPLLLHCF